MLFYIGSLIIVGSIVLGFIAEGGNILVLYQPYAAVIILGSAFGILIISNPQSILKSMWLLIKRLRLGTPYKKFDYLNLLIFMFFFFKYAKTKGIIAIEYDIENPNKSLIFNEFPEILKNKEAVTFFCDYMRLLVIGFDKSYELENLMQDQIAIRRNHNAEISSALFKIADALPALGIIAAVLGVINAMASINAEPAVLGHKIAAALIGTFIGVAVSYCAVTPLGSYMEKFSNDESKFLECIKAGFISYVNGTQPAIAIEFARQTVPINLKPSFLEVEKAIENHLKYRRMNKDVRQKPAGATR
ncbi:MAG: flagellar motor protein MotA [Candidatus Midichloriaceae bacterium]|jgi:chemotaxis protein MotA|nr:flagellar motor protein MotA [Candidatus Midichloriaceae bacterium]